MHVILLVAFSLIVTLSTAARADWAFTKWGMTSDQVVAASGGTVKLLTGTDRRTVAPNMRHEAEGTYTDDGVPLHVRFAFDPTNGNGLTCVFYAVENEKQADALRDMMTKRYGKPREGGGFGMKEYHWESPDDITLQVSQSEPAFAIHCKKNASR